jgi:hypothetical protein
MKIRKLSLVKYDYDSLPEQWKKEHTDLYKNQVFCYIGIIPNMPGHSYCQDIKTGKGHIFHPESLKELTEEET